MLLLERDLAEPDRIVGELLQPGGVIALDQLGMGDCLEGIDATPVEGYAVLTGERGERMVGVPYPALEAMAGEKVRHTHAEAAVREDGVDTQDEKAGAGGIGADVGRPWHVESLSGRKEGRSFHHGRLISSLRRKVIDHSDATVLEATVRDLIYCDHTDHVIGVTAAFKVARTTPGGEGEGETETIVRNVYAPLTIIADGCFSKFRSTRGARLPTPKTRSHFVGVILKDAELPLPRHGTVCLTPSGPVLLYQIGYEARETRMLVDVKGKLPSVADGSLKVGLSVPLHDAVGGGSWAGADGRTTCWTITSRTCLRSCNSPCAKRLRHSDSAPCRIRSSRRRCRASLRSRSRARSWSATRTICGIRSPAVE